MKSYKLKECVFLIQQKFSPVFAPLFKRKSPRPLTTHHSTLNTLHFTPTMSWMVMS